MPDTDEISKLLRLKRYEQPAPEYFENFARDFRRRQRSELLRQPLWRIALDRANVFFGEPTMGWHSYAAATAAALLLFLGISSFDSRSQGQGGQMASAPAAQLDKALPTSTTPTDLRTASSDTQTERPRYVIDTRPVSYPVNEPPFSF